MCCGVISALSVILAVSIPAVSILPPIPLRLSSLPHLAVAIVVVTIPAVAIPAVAIPTVVVGWCVGVRSQSVPALARACQEERKSSEGKKKGKE